MKKFLLFSIGIMFFTGLIFSDDSPAFQKLEKAIKNAVPDGYSLNRGQTRDNKLNLTITYDLDNAGMNRLIFNLNPSKSSFSAIDLAFDHKNFNYQERKALFLDGSKTGMSTLKIILKNNAGSFSITHRSLEGKAMNQPGLEKMLGNVNLGILEN